MDYFQGWSVHYSYHLVLSLVTACSGVAQAHQAVARRSQDRHAFMSPAGRDAFCHSMTLWIKPPASGVASTE